MLITVELLRRRSEEAARDQFLILGGTGRPGLLKTGMISARGPSLAPDDLQASCSARRCLLAACTTPPAAPEHPRPIWSMARSRWWRPATPAAARVGRDILERGGSAVDAAIAMQMVLTLVEPQSSGIGGGGFLLSYTANGKKLESYDGRERAPAAATSDMFLGAPMASRSPFPRSCRAVCRSACPVSCVCWNWPIASMANCLGAISFLPAIRMAEDGFEVSPQLGGKDRRR